LVKGIRIRTLVHGNATLMTEFLLERGRVLPSHSHAFEQTGYLVEGRIILHIGNESREMRRGDAWNIPSGVRHGADVIDDSIAIEIFSPAREDYLKYLGPAPMSGTARE